MTPPVVLFSSGLDSAVMLLDAAARYGGAQPVYVSAGLAWEPQEQAMAARFLRALPPSAGILPIVRLTVDMRDVYPASHWAVRGEAPGFDTPDEEVFIEGRNVVLLSKASVFAARAGLQVILIGPLAGNPFPDASPAFFGAMSRALSIGLASPIAIETPLLHLDKTGVIELGLSRGVPLGLTLSCMQPAGGKHCGRCSKCRERREGFSDVGVDDPAEYATTPPR